MATQKISGIVIKLTKDGPNIPYLIFVGDCIILCTATKRAVRNV